MAYSRRSYRDPFRNKDDSHVVAILVRRIVIACCIVFGTWNPSGYSYVSWARQQISTGFGNQGMTVLFGLVGAILLIGWIVGLWKAYHTLRRGSFLIWALLVVPVYGAIVFFVDLSTMQAVSAFIWILLLVMAVSIGIALTHGELRNLNRRLDLRRR